MNALPEIPILVVWRALGGAVPNKGRAPAFWRSSTDLNVSLDAERGLWKDFVSGTGGGVLALVQTVLRCETHDALKWLESEGLLKARQEMRHKKTRCGTEWREWKPGILYPAGWGTPTREYRYTDELNRPLYSVVRFEPKAFRPLYFDGGKWVWRKHPQLVLYRLPEVLKSPTVFYAEGEKDVETLREFGFIATTAPFGAGSPWLDSYSQALTDREVIIMPDNDESGRRRAINIARTMAPRVKRLMILELPEGKDVTEWFERGHSKLELISMVEEQQAVAA